MISRVGVGRGNGQTDKTINGLGSGAGVAVWRVWEGQRGDFGDVVVVVGRW